MHLDSAKEIIILDKQIFSQINYCPETEMISGKKLKKIQNCTKSLSASINGITGDDSITELWKNHYTNIFSSVPSDNMNATYLNSLSDEDKFSFTCAEDTKAVDSLTAGKAAGHSGISAEHLKNSDNTILDFLTLLLNDKMEIYQILQITDL